MVRNKVLILLLLPSTLFLFACAYIVLPADLDSPVTTTSKGWSAVVTNITKSDTGNLHIDLTLRNETGDWSAMKTEEGKPAALISGGKSTPCETVFVSTGGHRLAPGFQMRGYTGGTKSEPKIQLLYVECQAAQANPGDKLSIGYSYVTGQYNYYEQDKNKIDEIMEINLDQIAQGLVYPVAESVEGLIQNPDSEIIALNKVTLTLKDVQRSADGLEFTWETANPGEYPTYVHIGNPPVIGDDGILYGFYETPDIVSIPITPAGDKAEWTTSVSAPQDVKGFYIMLSVESGKARLFANYAVNISDK